MEFLRYHRDVLGKRCLLTYVLIDRRLASVRLHLLERYADKDRYVADYNKIREFLNAKVGEPRYNNVVWRNRADAERGETLGAAVTSGSLSLSSEWVVPGHGAAAQPDGREQRGPVRRRDQRSQGQESGLFLTLLSVFAPFPAPPRGRGPCPRPCPSGRSSC